MQPITSPKGIYGATPSTEYPGHWCITAVAGTQLIGYYSNMSFQPTNRPLPVGGMFEIFVLCCEIAVTEMKMQLATNPASTVLTDLIIESACIIADIKTGRHEQPITNNKNEIDGTINSTTID